MERPGRQLCDRYDFAAEDVAATSFQPLAAQASYASKTSQGGRATGRAGTAHQQRPLARPRWP